MMTDEPNIHTGNSQTQTPEVYILGLIVRDLQALIEDDFYEPSHSGAECLFFVSKSIGNGLANFNNVNDILCISL